MTADKTRTALLRAMKSNNVDRFVKVLNSKGWPKDSQWSDYELLLKALRLGRNRISHVILDKDARVWKKYRVNSPLHIAASKTATRWSKVIDRLLSRGAKVAAKNLKKDSALHVAFNSGLSGETIDSMLKAHLHRTKLDVVNKDGLRFLHIACTRPHLNFVRIFADTKRINLQVSLESSQVYAGYTPLHFAADNGRHEVAELLIEKGADVDIEDVNGRTPLHLALRLRDVRMIDLIFAHVERKRNIFNKFGLSHLMVACAGSKHIVAREYLAESQSLIPQHSMLSAQVQDVENYAGYTALHFAADSGQADTVEMLLNEGADCCAVTLDGLTCHVLAEKRGHREVCRILREFCDIAKGCKDMRSLEEDFGAWGECYERSLLIERVKEIKYLRKTLNIFKSMNKSFRIPALTVTLD